MCFSVGIRDFFCDTIFVVYIMVVGVCWGGKQEERKFEVFSFLADVEGIVVFPLWFPCCFNFSRGMIEHNGNAVHKPCMSIQGFVIVCWVVVHCGLIDEPHLNCVGDWSVFMVGNADDD